MRKSLVSALVVVAALASCNKKSKQEPPQTKPTTDETNPVTPDPTTTAPAPTPAPPAAPAPKVPDMADMEFKDWKIGFKAPAGTEVTNISPGDKAAKMPDNANLSTESTCGMDIDLSRHWKGDLADFYDSAKKDELKDIKFLTDEKTDAGFKVYYTGNAPLGPMWGVEFGTVVGDRLVLCSAGMDRLTEEEAACVLAVCSSIAGK